MQRIESSPVGRVLVRAVVGAVGVYVTYLVVINVLLASGLGEKLVNRISPTHATMSWSSASSTWFARFHVTNFVIRGTDSSTEWRITVDEGRTSIAPLALFGRKVHLYDVRARGVTMRLRSKLDAAKATADYVAKLPPIEGFADPPLAPAIRPPPPTDEHYDRVILQLDGIVAEDVRDVWVETVHVTDSGGRAEGSFYFKPMREVRVVAAADAWSGTLAIGKQTVVTQTHGVLGLRIDDLDPRVHDTLAHFDIEAHVTARTDDLSFFDPLLAPHGIALRGGTGPVDARIELRRGVIQPGSGADTRHEAWAALASRHSFAGRVTISHAKVDRRVTITAESYDVDVRHEDAQVARSPTVSTILTLPNRDLTRSFGDWSLAIDVPAAHLDDVRALNGYLHEAFLRGGSSRASAHATVDAHHVSGWTKIVCDRTSFVLGDATVLGDGSASFTLHDLDTTSGAGSFSHAQAELHDVTVGEQHGWWANVVAAPLIIDLSGELATSAYLTGTVRDGKAPLQILGIAGVVRWLVGGQRLVVGTHLRTSGAGFAFDDLRVVGDTLDVRGKIARSSTGEANGAFLASLPIVNMGVTIRDGKASTQPLASKSWYTHQPTPTL